MPEHLKQKVIVGISFAAVVYVGLSVWSNGAELAEALRSFSWAYLIPLLVLATSNYLLRFLKWQYYLVALGLQIPAWPSLLIFLSGFSMAVTPGKLGEVIKSYLLKDRYGIPMSRTAPIVVADRLTDLAALLMLTAVGAVSFHYGERAIIVITALLLVALVLLSQERAFRAVVRTTRRFRLVRRYESVLETLYASTAILIRPRALLITIPVAVVAWLAEGLAFYLTFKALHVPGDVLTALFIYSFSMIIGAVSFLPGGLGLTEATMAGLLVARDIGRAQAAAATIIVRLVTLWYAILIGAIALLLFQKAPRNTGERVARKEVA